MNASRLLVYDLRINTIIAYHDLTIYFDIATATITTNFRNFVAVTSSPN